MVKSTVIAAALSASAFVQGASPRPDGPLLLQDGQLRIFYRTTGEDAVKADDANHNGIPDQVEDTLTQLKAAHLFYCKILGFPDPFETLRYRGASFLDITFRKRETLGSNGKAYDEVRPTARREDPAGTRCLRVGLATSIQPAANPTPAHEFFHVIQYSTTYFKNRWFTEGTARWSQRSFGIDGAEGERNVEPWPVAPEKRVLLAEMAYEAAPFFWKPLARRYDGDGTIPASEFTGPLQAMTYVDGSKVWKPGPLPGWRLIREVLQRLDAADDLALRALGGQTWSKEAQRSTENNRFLFDAVGQAVEKFSSAK